MDKDLVVSAMRKILNNNNSLTQEELNELKEYIKSNILFHVDEVSITAINIATTENIISVFNEIIIRNIKNSFKIRYGN